VRDGEEDRAFDGKLEAAISQKFVRHLAAAAVAPETFEQQRRPDADAARLNAHYSQRSGFKVYSHLSDRYAPFYTKLIAATASEALHVLDALLYHQSEVAPRRHRAEAVVIPTMSSRCAACWAFSSRREFRPSSTAGSTASASRPCWCQRGSVVFCRCVGE
jgi:hypothetical protein